MPARNKANVEMAMIAPGSKSPGHFLETDEARATPLPINVNPQAKNISEETFYITSFFLLVTTHNLL